MIIGNAVNIFVKLKFNLLSEYFVNGNRVIMNSPFVLGSAQLVLIGPIYPKGCHYLRGASFCVWS